MAKKDERDGMSQSKPLADAILLLNDLINLDISLNDIIENIEVVLKYIEVIDEEALS